MTEANLYQTLGVPTDATAADIVAAYKRGLEDLRERLNTATSPDPGMLDALRKAYQVLADPVARRSHDASLGIRPVSAPPAPVETQVQAFRFSFVGGGSEYFRIWIVNLLLSVLTLGIYSAWAKVRREQYFHRNLLLNESGFDYHGEAKAILKGRAIAFGLLMIVSTAQKISPMAYGLTVLVLVPVVPWLVVRALRFRAHNTSYRGLRFSFRGTYRGALIAFIGYGLLAAITLGLLFPLFLRKQKKFVLDNLSYGTARFTCDVPIGRFYRIFAVPLVAFVAFAAALAVLASLLGSMAMVVVPVFLIGAVILIQLLAVPYLTTRITNLVWNGTHVADSRFRSSLALRPYVVIVASNLLLLVLTLGLFWPWARIRIARYRADCLTLHSSIALDDFVAGEATGASAIGDEMAGMFDFDVAL